MNMKIPIDKPGGTAEVTVTVKTKIDATGPIGKTTEGQVGIFLSCVERNFVQPPLVVHVP
jgi:hypothetical protein